MSDKKKEEEERIEREILLNRPFSLSEAIAREGGDYMKGASAIPPLEQAEGTILEFLGNELVDSPGALRAILWRHIHLNDTLLAKHFDSPLKALDELLNRYLSSEPLLKDFVRDVDAEWGRIHNERPHFETGALPPHPDDAYTVDSVRSKLTKLKEKIGA
jgi:hypothetical protein